MTDFASTTRPIRRALLWLLVALVPLQGTTAGVLGVLGPAHVHKIPKAETLVLDDFRRDATPGLPRATHVATAFGHFHAGGVALRHYHPRSDTSVVPLDDGGSAQGTDGNGPGFSPSLALFAAMLPSSAVWLDESPEHSRATHAAWPSLTHDPQPLERPPRAA